ncbi:MAG: hypothetical protein LBP34_00895 [Flavobacteriaceae bacterium]|nr:hypothetical protein [Flavobacteriaceae bacterium]
MNKPVLVTGVLFFFHGFMFCQNKLVSELKTYALCSCITNNYRAVDNTFNSKDITKAAIVQINPISVETIESLEKYVEDKTMDFYKGYNVYTGYDFSNPNMIIYNCTEFYKSKELRQYIRKLIKIKKSSGNNF